MDDQPSAPVERTRHLPTLDGWRAIAILIVLLNHDRIRQVGYLSTAWFHQNGRRGVDIFFALSGLLICSRLLEEEQIAGSISLRRFYTRRLFRIQPAALTYLGVIALLMLCGVLYKAYTGVLLSVASVRNYFPLSFSAHDWYTGHFWTLSVEEHFYLLLPFFLVCIRRHRVAALSALVVVIEAWKQVVSREPALQFGWYPAAHTDIAVDGIVLACIGAMLLRQPRVLAWCKAWLTPYATIPLMMMTLWLVWYGHNRNHFPATEFVLVCLYPLVIASTMLQPLSWPSRLLETRPLRLLGRISYSLYIWQMLFLTFAYDGPAPHPTLLTTIQHSWWRYPCTFLAALLSYYLIEKPMIRAGHRLATRSGSRVDVRAVEAA
jgi:peptidoglycan/LPS O-acetylase OafA/YrhL